MKKIFFGVAILSFWLSGNAQEKMTHEQARLICAKGMLSFTKAVSGAYKAGNSYGQFQTALCGNVQLTIEGANQLKAAYNFIVQSTPADAIVKNYSGKEVAASLNYLLNLHKRGIESDGSELFGGKTGTANPSFAKNTEGGCKWYQFACLAQAALNWIVMQWAIITGLDDLLNGPLASP